MSRRALSDNLDRVVADPGDEATARDGRFSASFMKRAIELAAPTQPHPNPRVGCVIVADDGIVGEGAHIVAGEPHAEVLALAAAGERARGATAYVTLEPCSHQGRTPPCAEALEAAGVARVIIGAVDPDERVSGLGIAALQSAGIEVITDVLSSQVEAMDPGYFHHRRTGRPLITLKLATTLDGQIAAADRTSQWITGEEARMDGHRLRAEADVVIVGAGTVRDDDPRLDVRLNGYTGRQPRPVIVAGIRPLPEDAALMQRDALTYTPDGTSRTADNAIVAGGADRVDLAAMIDDLGKRGYVAALVEGGSALAGELLRGGHVDRIVFYLAAKVGVGQGLGAFGGTFETIADAVAVHIESVDRVGEDLRIETRVGS